MKTFYSLVCGLFFSLQITTAQLPIIDSLRIVYANAEDDSTRWAINAKLFSFFTQVQADSTFVYAKRANELALQSQNQTHLGLSYDLMGRAYILKGEYKKAQENLIQSSEIFRKIGNKEFLIDVECTMARVLIDQGDFKNAKKYLHNALHYYRTYDPKNRKILVPLIRFGLLFEKTEEVDSVILYTQEALEVTERLGIQRLQANVNNNLATAYNLRGDYIKAEYHYRKAITLAKVNDPSTLDHATYGLAEIFEATGQIDSSIHYSMLTADYAKTFGDKDNEAGGYEIAARNYARKKDFENAYRYHLLFREISDTLLMERARKDFQELTIQYETQQKEAQIVQQQLLLEQETNRRNLILFAAAFLIVLLSALFYYGRYQQSLKQQKADLELQLKEAEAQKLKEIDQLKSTFFANISHEFRTPLTLILGPLREMTSNTFKGNPQKYFQIMIRNGERLLNLINQILELAQLDSKNAQLQTEGKEFVKFTRLLVSSFESLALRKQIYFRWTLPKDPIYVEIDTDKIEKIITNLLSNAIKFTPEEGRVEFTLRELTSKVDEEKILEITVEDTGIGISEEQLPHIFNRFYTSAKIESEFGNIGIGLALTKELVTLHKGTISVQSKSNQGAVFIIQLPLKIVKPDNVVPVKEETLAYSSTAVNETNIPYRLALSTTSNAPSILVVEDNPDLRNYIMDHLKEHYNAIEATHGQQGLDLALTHIPDLIVSDLVMPKLDGFELCEQLKQNEKTSHIPIILLTAKADQPSKLKGLSIGADAYLEKPFDMTELAIRIEKLIERNQILRQAFSSSKGNISINAEFATPAEETFLQKVVQIIEEQLDNENFSIEELGKAIGMSRSQLHRKIKALTNLSPSVFLRTIRLEHAYKLLEQKAGNISEIAFRVGFSNLSYFSRSFSNHFGFPPSELVQK